MDRWFISYQEKDGMATSIIEEYPLNWLFKEKNEGKNPILLFYARVEEDLLSEETKEFLER